MRRHLWAELPDHRTKSLQAVERALPKIAQLGPEIKMEMALGPKLLLMRT